jgi:HEAT repeat protein
MRRIADDYGAETGARLAAAGVLVEGRAPGAEAGFQTLVGIAVGSHPAAAAGALIHKPSATSVQSLVLLAGNADRDAKYIATSALARLGAKEALPVLNALKAVAADRESGAARLVAHIGLAAAGDAESLRVLNETLPLLTGRDLLEAGRALVRLKDPRGPSIVRTIAEGNDEILRIEAAEVLHESQPALAANLIRTTSQSDNPWVRARALEAAAVLRIVPTLSMRRAMLDSNSWVAIRAVQAITAGEPEPLRPAPPRPLEPEQPRSLKPIR